MFSLLMLFLAEFFLMCFFKVHLIIFLFNINVKEINMYIYFLMQPGYLLSFYFFLDIISTLSLVLDVKFLYDYMFSGGNSSIQQGEIAKNARVSRVGARAGRMVRIIRLIRLVRIVKVYKHVYQGILMMEKQKTLKALLYLFLL